MAASQSLCGYSCKHYINDVEKYLHCKACLCVAKRLRYTSCCWTPYCGEYVQNIQEHGSPCPACGKNSFISYERVAIQLSVENIEVYCDEKESGCLWMGTLSRLEQHLKECSFVTITCPLDCQQTLVRKHLHRHLVEECKKKPPKEDQVMREQEIQALYEELENCTNPHLEKDIYLYEFRMENYSRIKAEKREWRSPRMFTQLGGYKFYVSINTYVFGDESQRALQADLWAVRGEFDDDLDWPVVASFTMSLIDSKGNREEHTIKKKDWDRPEDQRKLIGHFDSVKVGGNFAFVEDDELQKYLIGDSLTFQIFVHDVRKKN